MARSMRLIVVMAVALAVGVGAAGCDDAEKQLDRAKQRIGEAVIRNAAAIAGTEAFKENGHELKDTLDCTADVTSDNKATLSCTGTTKDGKAATLDGTANDDTAEKGSFVGKVDGQEVFSQDCLDCK
jgi:hypothetical protein